MPHEERMKNVMVVPIDDIMVITPRTAHAEPLVINFVHCDKKTLYFRFRVMIKAPNVL